MTDPFEILGVKKDCTPEELRGAYRKLARRWHPDRFLAGPEREWANEHMTEINAAYAECVELLRGGRLPVNEGSLDGVHALIRASRYSEARRALLRIDGRCARWNYLFGLVLRNQGEVAKSLTYFNFAVRQEPDNGQYRRTRDAVQHIVARERVASVLRSLRPARIR